MPSSAVAALCPVLSEAAEEAVLVWRYMGEWRPEAIPALVALLDVQHVDGLLERLMAIAVAVREQRSDA